MKFKIIFWLVAFMLLGYLIFHWQTKKSQADKTIIISGNNQEDKTKAKASLYYPALPKEQKEKVNILLIGLDARAGDNRPRCDAIHMISFTRSKGEINIISVPRGTPIEAKNLSAESAYLGNLCHVEGIEPTIAQIEKITQTKADYIVKIGFSQTMGILRLLNLPAVDTLQFLRNRQNPLGDVQRSYNQALFLKDFFLNYFEKISSMPDFLKYRLFNLLDTNISYTTALDLAEELKKSQLHQKPHKITITLKPNPNLPVANIHYDFKKTNNVITDDPEYQNYQTEIKTWLENLINNAQNQYTNHNKNAAFQIISVPFKQKLWEQIEDKEKRNELYFQVLEIFVLASPNPAKQQKLLLDFIEEMKSEQAYELVNKAQNLLQQISS